MTWCHILGNRTGLPLLEARARAQARAQARAPPALARAPPALARAQARAPPALGEKCLVRYVPYQHLPTPEGLALHLLPHQTSLRDSLGRRIPYTLIQDPLEFHTGQ